MRTILLIALATVLLAGCGENRTKSEVGQVPEDNVPAKADCLYSLHNDLTGETTAMSEFPPGVYPSGQVKSGGVIVAVTLADPSRPERDETLIIPACKQNEALQIIETRQEADVQQARQGIPFEERTYP